MILLRLMMLFYIFAQILKISPSSPPPAISASGWQFDLSEFPPPPNRLIGKID
jgi:hypothetical protein